MIRTEVEKILDEFYPKYWRSRFVDHEHTNRFGETLVETSMYKNRWVQITYDKDSNVKVLLVMVYAGYGTTPIISKQVKTLDEFKKALNL